MKKGFTLIELLISLFILGVLILMSEPFYSKYLKESEINSNLTSLNFFKTSISVCIQIKPKEYCNGGVENIPRNFNNKNTINGFDSITTKKSNILVVTTTINPLSNKNVIVFFEPIVHRNHIQWLVSCSDFDIGTIVYNCSKQY